MSNAQKTLEFARIFNCTAKECWVGVAFGAQQMHLYSVDLLLFGNVDTFIWRSNCIVCHFYAHIVSIGNPLNGHRKFNSFIEKNHIMTFDKIKIQYFFPRIRHILFNVTFQTPSRIHSKSILGNPHNKEKELMKWQQNNNAPKKCRHMTLQNLFKKIDLLWIWYVMMKIALLK